MTGAAADVEDIVGTAVVKVVLDEKVGRAYLSRRGNGPWRGEKAVVGSKSLDRQYGLYGRWTFWRDERKGCPAWSA